MQQPPRYTGPQFNPQQQKQQNKKQKQERKKQKPKKHKKSKGPVNWKNIVINTILVFFILFGLILIFNQPIKAFIVKNMTEANLVNKLDKDTIEKNKKKVKEVGYDFNKVKSVDISDIINARLNPQETYVVGGIAVPSVGLNLPIALGLSDYVLVTGAGTLKENEKMGEGNYALASHHMIQKELLFGPLVNIELGAVIYLTDLTTIYQYRTNFKEYVAPNRTELIADDQVKDKPIVTLVTCDQTGNQRLIVQGVLETEYPVKEAPKEAAEAFNLETNTYKN